MLSTLHSTKYCYVVLNSITMWLIVTHTTTQSSCISQIKCLDYITSQSLTGPISFVNLFCLREVLCERGVSK